MDFCHRFARSLAEGTAGLAALITVLSGTAANFPTASAQTSETSEVTTRETQPTYKLQVQRNVILVRVVVRDGRGRVVGNLRKEDFRLFDNRKPQVITHFSGETSAAVAPATPAPQPQPEQPAEESMVTAPAPSTPQHFLGLYFDDLNMAFEDVVYARDTADRYLAANLAAGDRVGIFTSSGRQALDFTDDLGKLHEALFRLRPSSRINPRSECPEISDFQADRIVNLEDKDAYDLAADDAADRCPMVNIRMQAELMLHLYIMQARQSLEGLDQLVTRVATLPGQRSIVLVSLGFMPFDFGDVVGEIIDRALRSRVIIGTLDPKGLAVLLREADASRRRLPPPRLVAVAHLFDMARESAASAVLADLAEGTGGVFFHNSNDLDAGFRKVSETPQVYYVLAFTPQNLKYDGGFHKLKVTLADKRGLVVQARPGYFAPKKLLDPAAQAKEEIEAAAFSRNEMKEIPLDVQTQFFSTPDGDAELAILARLDLRSVQFRKEAGRNLNNLTFVTLLFDRDGNLVASKQQELELRVLDASLEKLLQRGVRVKTTFSVKPGTYQVREVVRESEEGHLSALNSTVEIPF